MSIFNAKQLSYYEYLNFTFLIDEIYIYSRTIWKPKPNRRAIDLGDGQVKKDIGSSKRCTGLDVTENRSKFSLELGV